MRVFIVLCLGTLLLVGCPPAKGDSDVNQTSGPDEFDSYVSLLQSADGVRDELKRLQNACTGSEQGSSGTNSLKYSLSVEVIEGAVDVVLNGRDDTDTWRLRSWTPNLEEELPVNIIKNETTTGGHYFEASIGSTLIYSMQLRWLSGGALQVSRSILLGGLNKNHKFEDDNCNWVISGSWLPYRMLPQYDGPWGVVALADGAWNNGYYPGACRLPAVAAYDDDHGWLLAIADEHARTIDRSYELGWRVDPNYEYGEQVQIHASYFSAELGEFTSGNIVSGQELRDSVILMPLVFPSRSTNPTSVEVYSARIVDSLSRYVRMLHFTPKQSNMQVNGNAVYLSDWLVSEEGINPTQQLDLMSATTNITYTLMSAEELESGAISEEIIESLTSIRLIPIAESPVHDTWFGQGDSRDHVFAAGLLRNIRETASLSDTGLCWLLPRLTLKSSVDTVGEYSKCLPMQEATLALKAAENARESRPNAVLFGYGSPSLCLPSHMDCYITGTDQQGDKSSENIADISTPFNPLSARMDNLLTAKVFNANHIVSSPDSTLAGLVLAATGYQVGFLFDDAVRQYDGFDAFSKGTESLTWIDQELLVLYCDPIASIYSLEGERPAQCSELVALNTSRTDLASALWVVFEGIGGSVKVDNHNVLTVSWAEGNPDQMWTTVLPVGYWAVEHPNPMDVESGDAVLVLKGTITPMGPGDSAVL